MSGMAKEERFESRLSAEGRAALEKLAAYYRVSRAAVIEMVLAEAERRLPGAVNAPSVAPSVSPPKPEHTHLDAVAPATGSQIGKASVETRPAVKRARTFCEHGAALGLCKHGCRK